MDRDYRDYLVTELNEIATSKNWFLTNGQKQTAQDAAYAIDKILEDKNFLAGKADELEQVIKEQAKAIEAHKNAISLMERKLESANSKSQTAQYNVMQWAETNRVLDERLKQANEKLDLAFKSAAATEEKVSKLTKSLDDVADAQTKLEEERKRLYERAELEKSLRLEAEKQLAEAERGEADAQQQCLALSLQLETEQALQNRINQLEHDKAEVMSALLKLKTGVQALLA
jgi:chromosome segregation ATPase